MSENNEKETQKIAVAPKKRAHTPIYTLVVAIYWLLAKLVFRMKIVGREHVPAQGNYIIMGNHVSLFDPLTLALCARRKEIHFMGKKELFQNKLLAWAFAKVHAFPVDRGNMDMGAIRTAMKVIKGGDTLGIFPEGTRSKTGEMGPLLGGAGVLALKSGAAVVPVYIGGNYRPFRRMRVVVGPCVQLDDLRAQGVDKAACDAFTRRLEDEFARLKKESEKI